jgi:hypothetical protein
MQKALRIAKARAEWALPFQQSIGSKFADAPDLVPRVRKITWQSHC